MNNVTIVGKIVSMIHKDNVSFITVHTKDGKNSEYIDITVFNQELLKKYFVTGMWIGIVGRIHKNKRREYRLEIIANTLFFVGDIDLNNIIRQEEKQEMCDFRTQTNLDSEWKPVDDDVEVLDFGT